MAFYICIDGDIHLVTHPRLKRRIQAMGNNTDTNTNTDTDLDTDTNKENDALSSMDSRLRISTTDDRWRWSMSAVTEGWRGTWAPVRARGSGGKNVIFLKCPYDQSKYSDPLIYISI
jgi:hypothetical protein